jgi:aerobic carbon-monoxide dehydrogenase large subunit
MAKLVGQPIKRVEDPRFIQGKGGYVANISLPGMAYVAIKRSPYAHAKIKKIDASKAKALPGVVAVFTGQDLIDGGVGKLPCGWNVPNIKVPARWPLAPDKVRHVGDGVVAVVAEDQYIAEDALNLIDVDYEVLPAVVGAKAAVSNKTLVHDDLPKNTTYEWPLGDKAGTEAAIKSSDHVIELDLINQRLIPNAMEPRAAVAQWNKFTEEMTLWTTSQNPHPIRLLLSAFTLGIPENRLRVISPDVGGGFGSKIFHYPEEIIVPWIAKKINRAIKWVSTRTEASQTDSQGRDHVSKAKLGVSKDGKINALWVETYADHGAYISTFAPLIPTAFYHCLLSGCYKIPHIFGVTIATITNTVPVDAYRGAGRPEAAYLVERIVDIAARRLKMDPVEFRRKNFLQPSEFPYQTPVAMIYDSGDYDKMLNEALRISNLPELYKKRDAARAAGKLAGVGIATAIEASGPAPSKVAGSLGSAVGFWESAQLRVHPTGKISVMTGSHTHGQGHETAFAQLVADQLGVPMADIEIVHGDTGKVPFGMGSYGSRSLSVGGSAIVTSANKLREKMKKIAAHQLEASVDDIVYDTDAGKLYVKGSPNKSKSVFDVSLAAYTAHNLPDGLEPGLEDTSFYDPANFTFPSSAHIVYVEIDKDTGVPKIEKYFAVEDVGNVVNPMIVEGQVQGGIVQGVGQALYEDAGYDDNGQMAATFMDYAMPKAEFFPMIESSRTVTPSPHNPLGAKGAGEMGTITSTVAVSNAVHDALAPLGIEHVDLPLTAPRLWKAINKK